MLSPPDMPTHYDMMSIGADYGVVTQIAGLKVSLRRVRSLLVNAHYRIALLVNSTDLYVDMVVMIPRFSCSQTVLPTYHKVRTIRRNLSASRGMCVTVIGLLGATDPADDPMPNRDGQGDHDGACDHPCRDDLTMGRASDDDRLALQVGLPALLLLVDCDAVGLIDSFVDVIPIVHSGQ